MPWAVGAICTGAPASTATASPCPTPAAARPPAIRRARACTSAQLCRTGASGSPVTMPFLLHWALLYIVSVNRLTTIPLAYAQLRRVFEYVGNPARICRRARNFGSRWGSTVARLRERRAEAAGGGGPLVY